MRILLFSVTAGDGHNATANAIARSLEEKGCQVKIADAYRTAGPLLYHAVSKGYLVASTYLKYGYGVFYRFFEHRPSNSYRLSPARLSGRPLAKKFKRIIDEYAPDVIITTHPFASRILDITKERHGFRAKSVGIVTDFTLHPYWEEALRLDNIVIPAEALTPLALKKGIEKEKILPLGIPIHPKFDTVTSKREAREALGLRPDVPTLLLMAGTVGCAGLPRTVKQIDKLPFPKQIIVVCGKNKRAYRKIASHLPGAHVLPLGYTQNMPLLMDAADLIVSKPGGLTTSEALTRVLPMVIVKPIPGQEERNTDFLVANGCALRASRKHPISACVSRILTEEGLLTQMSACAEKLKKPCATADFCNLVLSLAQEDLTAQ